MPAEICHGGIEVRGFVRVCCHVVERLHAKGAAKSRFAGLDAVEEIAPGLLGNAAEQECPSTHRAGHAGAQAGADRRQREFPILFLGEHVRARKEAKDAPERIRLRSGRLG